MPTSKQNEKETSTSHGLDIVEAFAVVAAIGGSIVAAVSQQIAMATIPLSLTATLTLVNRRRHINAVLGQQRLTIAHNIQHSHDVIQAELAAVQQANEAVQSRLQQLNQQDTQALQTITTLTSQTVQMGEEIETLQHSQAQDQASLTALGEQTQLVQSQLEDLSPQLADLNDAISHLQSSTADLEDRVAAQHSNSQYLAAQTKSVEDLLEILRAMDAITQAISDQPDGADRFYERGLLRKRLQRLEDQHIALDDFSKAIQLESTYAGAYFERGLLHSELGQKQRAVDDFHTAAKLYFEQGQLNQYEQARELAQKIHDLIASPSAPDGEIEPPLVETLFS